MTDRTADAADCTLHNVYCRRGRAECKAEIDLANADHETVVRDLIGGQFRNPFRVVAYNVVEGWSRDVSEDMAHEIQRRAHTWDISADARQFCELHGLICFEHAA